MRLQGDHIHSLNLPVPGHYKAKNATKLYSRWSPFAGFKTSPNRFFGSLLFSSFRRFFGSQEGFDDCPEVNVGSVGSGGSNGVSRGLRKSLSKLSFLLPQEWKNVFSWKQTSFWVPSVTWSGYGKLKQNLQNQAYKIFCGFSLVHFLYWI